MKLFSALFLIVSLNHVQGQGTFTFNNPFAQTRLGSLDGPLAQTNIYAQMLVGLTPDSLTPVGPTARHVNGSAFNSYITVPGINGGMTAYIQMVAWDSLLWGTSLANVPLNQLGRTDIVPHILSYPTDSPFSPLFQQPAIVPVPEPAVFALLALGGAVAWALRRKPR